MTEIMDVDTEPVKTAQTIAPDSEPTSWMSPTGEIRDGAPDNVKKLLETKKWTNVEQIVDNYNLLEKQQGIGEHLVIPNADDPEFVAKFDNIYKQLGRPETHDKYEFSTESQISLSDELMDGFRQFAHNEGYTQKQYEGAINFQLDAIAKAIEIDTAQKTVEIEEEEAEKEKIRNAFKQKWGGEVAFQDKIREAKILADKLGIYQTLEKKGLASDPEIINMLDIIEARTAEDVIAGEDGGAVSKTAIEERDEIMKNPIFKDKFARGRKELMARYMELNQIIANSGQSSQPNSR